jgi:hypothetical protein
LFLLASVPKYVLYINQVQGLRFCASRISTPDPLVKEHWNSEANGSLQKDTGRYNLRQG